jgi:hypothetical protein
MGGIAQFRMPLDPFARAGTAAVWTGNSHGGTRIVDELEAMIRSDRWQIFLVFWATPPLMSTLAQAPLVPWQFNFAVPIRVAAPFVPLAIRRVIVTSQGDTSVTDARTKV